MNLEDLSLEDIERGIENMEVMSNLFKKDPPDEEGAKLRDSYRQQVKDNSKAQNGLFMNGAYVPCPQEFVSTKRRKAGLEPHEDFPIMKLTEKWFTLMHYTFSPDLFNKHITAYMDACKEYKEFLKNKEANAQ